LWLRSECASAIVEGPKSFIAADGGHCRRNGRRGEKTQYAAQTVQFEGGAKYCA
jgi:hypothetical protein